MIDALAWLIIGALGGGWAGWQLRGRQRSNREPRIYAVQANLKAVVYLRDFGTIEQDRAFAFASRIARGVPIRYRTLVGKGKLLRRSQWDRIVSGEMVSRGVLVRNTDKTLAPSPEFTNFCAKLVASRARAARTGRTGVLLGAA